MKILAVDTSTDVCSLCVTIDNHRVAEYASKSKITHTERLLPAVDMVFAHLGWKISEIDALAVIHGPGSFTGLRIGLSVVKGIALAVGCPVVAANALEIAARQVPASGLISPAMDARRGEIFTALYRKEGEELIEVMAPQSIAPELWRSRLPEESVDFCGPGAALYFELLRHGAESRLWFRDFFLAGTL
ncbi:MAG TPA: tRNA (adenosine(37)-N6)-threonylcarbamoyltransferase complex dimerization subunit type 1 TsaB, partial [Acidobacteriota bacterium]|nr:tRNA (adenosine(37)-N6)-threonylcarbamoyltransferase complex dimerization subunit type 1 TsaB [Acidobacteriota bacterium]